MPSKEIISARAAALQTVKSPAGRGIVDEDTMYGDNEIWEGTEAEAHFKITKEIVPTIIFPIYSLSVSGEPSAVKKVISDFIGALGEPLGKDLEVEQIPGVKFVIWDANKIDRKKVSRH